MSSTEAAPAGNEHADDPTNEVGNFNRIVMSPKGACFLTPNDYMNKIFENIRKRNSLYSLVCGT